MLANGPVGPDENRPFFTNSSEENEATSSDISLDKYTELNVEEDIENVERITLIEDKSKLRSHVWNNLKRYFNIFSYWPTPPAHKT